MNVNEIFEMNLSELTFEQFAVAMVFFFLCAALVIILVSAICELLKLIVDLGFYLFGKNKRLGGWWFKRDLCRYIGSLKHQTIKASTEKAYYLYYNRLIGAVEALFYVGLIDNDLYLKFAAKGIPSYYDLKKERAADENKPTEERPEVDTDK